MRHDCITCGKWKDHLRGKCRFNDGIHKGVECCSDWIPQNKESPREFKVGVIVTVISPKSRHYNCKGKLIKIHPLRENKYEVRFQHGSICSFFEGQIE